MNLSTLSFLSVNLYEKKLKFYLNKPFKGVYGNKLGSSIGNCTILQTNSIYCEAQHTEKPDWLMSTTTEFYNIGIIQINNLPYKDDLTVKKYYERLRAEGEGIRSQTEKRQVPCKLLCVC